MLMVNLRMRDFD